jgi:hypothetical protein
VADGVPHPGVHAHGPNLAPTSALTVLRMSKRAPRSEERAGRGGCLAKHPDGRIYGFRAAIRYERLKDYERIQSVNNKAAANGRGLSGAFSQLLRRYPDLEKFLLREAKQRHAPINEAREVRKTVKRIHKRFLEECRKAGVKSNEYPLNQDFGGLRSLAVKTRLVIYALCEQIRLLFVPILERLNWRLML